MLFFETMVSVSVSLSLSLSLRFTSHLCICTPRIVFSHQINHHCSWLSQRNPRKNLHCFVKPIGQNGVAASSVSNDYPLSGLDDVLIGYIFGKKKATEVAHLVWKRIVHKGDTAIDATCGNGFDTLAMLKLVADESGRGRVYGLDIQKDALENTTTMLDESLDPNVKELVKLFPICHSRMDELVPDGSLVRLVAFNLGYLPGGDKAITTTSGTTILALEAAKKILAPGGLISIVVYIGHPGGREEYDAIQGFASGLSVDNWVCCKFQMLNRSLAPVLIFLVKK